MILITVINIIIVVAVVIIAEAAYGGSEDNVFRNMNTTERENMKRTTKQKVAG